MRPPSSFFTEVAGSLKVCVAMTYDYRRYNQHDVLKPHWGFWLTVLFLSRHVIGFVLVSMSGSGLGGRGGGVGKDAIELGSVMSLIEPIYMIADIPALMLLYALGARLPKSGTVIRWVWGGGRWLMLASVAIYLALFVLTRGVNVEILGRAAWASLAFNTLLVSYVLGSNYMKDLFGQFPPADASRNS